VKTLEHVAIPKPIVAFDLPENRLTAVKAVVYAANTNELEFGYDNMKLNRRRQMLN